MMSVVISLVLLAIHVQGNTPLDSGITCTTRSGGTARGVGAKSKISCQSDEIMVSCGISGVQHIGGTEGVTSKDGTACSAKAHSGTYSVKAVANCCKFTENSVERVFTVKSSGASGLETATCPSGSTLTGCDVYYAWGAYNQLLGAFAGVQSAPPQTSGWIDTGNTCTAGSRSGTGVTSTAHCMEMKQGFELECSARATYTKTYGFVGCEEGFRLMACQTWTDSNSLDAYYIRDGRCYVQQDNHANQYANGICCRVRKPEWKILVGQDTATGGYFLPEVIRSTGLTNPGQPHSNAFSIVGAVSADDYRSNGQYQFRLRYDDGHPMSKGDVFDQIWTQTNWLTDDQITGSSLGEHQACPDFYGLAMSTGYNSNADYSYLDGNGHHNCWYHPVGMTTIGGEHPSYEHNMPIDQVPGNVATKAQLFVCTVGKDCDYSTPLAFEPASSEPCYYLNGNPGTISGDPHTFTFAGVRHDFQGQPQNGLDQFYYVHPCKGYNHNDLPFHLLGTHVPWRGSTRVSGLDYFVIELFDVDDVQYNVFMSSAIQAYAQTENTKYDDPAIKSSLVQLENIKTVAIGTRFRIHFTQSDAKSIAVTLTIDDECTLEFTMIAQNEWNGALNRYRMHYARVNVPECYRCASCGLFGNFRGKEMEDCHGKYVGYGGYENAWDARGWTWEKTYTNDECPVLDTTTTMPPNATPNPTKAPVTPSPLPEEPCIDPESHARKVAYDKCMAARNREDVAECCDKISDEYCNIDECEFDVCIMSDGDTALMDDIVDDILTDIILKECDEISVDSSNWSEEFTAKPTKKPTPEPTDNPAKPTPQPSHHPTTAEPTHRPSHNPTTSEPTEKPSHHPTTAYPTHRPSHNPTTSEPTHRPSHNPTTAEPTHRPSHNPTTSEPTEKPSHHPTTARPTHRPTHHPTDEPTRRPSHNPTTREPTHRPSHHPTTAEPTHRPSHNPTTSEPTKRPSHNPTTARPTHRPSQHPTTAEPTHRPSHNPTTSEPTKRPSHNPTTSHPSRHPTTSDPTRRPSHNPTTSMPSRHPTTSEPTHRPSHNPTTAEPTKRPSHTPTTMDPTKRPSTDPTTSEPTRRPTSDTYLTPEPSRTYLTPEPTKKPTEDQSGWGEPQPTPKPPKTKAPKPTKAPKTKKPKPTKAPKTSKPTKAPKTKKPKPSKPPKTGKPTRKPTKDKSGYLVPPPSHTDTYLTPEPSMRGNHGRRDRDRESILAVDVTGSTETTLTGYSMQVEIVGLVSIVTVLLIIGYSMMCKKDKNEQYIAIEDPNPRVV